MPPNSFRPEVYVDGGWSSNALRFRTEAEALAYARYLFSRWTLCQDARAVACEDTPTYAWGPEGLRRLADAAE